MMKNNIFRRTHIVMSYNHLNMLRDKYEKFFNITNFNYLTNELGTPFRTNRYMDEEKFVLFKTKIIIFK